jgi:hypothetical protein
MDDMGVLVFEMLVERMTNVEQSIEVMKEIKKVEQRNAPSGSELCGSLYRRGSLGKELTILKNYSGRLEPGSLLAVTLGDDWNDWNGWTDWWTCTPGWSRGQERSWVDVAVEAEIGLAQATAVRCRCRELMEAAADTPKLLSGDVGMVGRGALDAREELRHAWFRTAVMNRVPGVRDIAGGYILLDGFDIETNVMIVDRIFDLCGMKKTALMTLQIMPSAMTEISGALFKEEEADLIDLLSHMTETRRTEIKRHVEEWTERRSHMTPEQIEVDDNENLSVHSCIVGILNSFEIYAAAIAADVPMH